MQTPRIMKVKNEPYMNQVRAEVKRIVLEKGCRAEVKVAVCQVFGWEPRGKRKGRQPRRHWEDELDEEIVWWGLGSDD